MESPKFRNKISLSAKGNSALKDILTPTSVGVEVESIESIIAPLHNTKVVIKTDLRKAGQTVTESERYSRRVITYNRVDINTILPEGYTPSSTVIATEVEKLNSLHSCDFTEDDILIEGGKIVANPNSLGYRNAVIVSPPDGAGQKMDQLKFDAFLQIIPANEPTFDLSSTADIVVLVNGFKNSKTVSWSPDQSPHISLIYEIIEYVKQCANVDLNLNRVINYAGRIYDDEDNASAFPITGGNFTIKNLDSTNLDIGISIKYTDDGDVEHITVLPLMRLFPKGSTKSFADNLPHILRIEIPQNKFYENGVDEEDDVDYTKFKVNGLSQGLKVDYDKLFTGDNRYGRYSTFDNALFNFCIGNTILTNQSGWLDHNGTYCCFLENLSEQPLSIEIAGVEYQLGVNQLEQRNNIFRSIIDMRIMRRQYHGRIVGAEVVIDGDTYNVTQPPNQEEWWDYEVALSELKLANNALDGVVDFHMGSVPRYGMVGLTVENKSLAPIEIEISIQYQGGRGWVCLNSTIIAPVGNNGSSWTREQLYNPVPVTLTESLNLTTTQLTINGITYPPQQPPEIQYLGYLEGVVPLYQDGQWALSDRPMGLVVSVDTTTLSLPPSLITMPRYAERYIAQ